MSGTETRSSGKGRVQLVLGALAITALLIGCGDGEIANKVEPATSTTTAERALPTLGETSGTDHSIPDPSPGATVAGGTADGVLIESTTVPPDPAEIESAWREGLALFQERDYPGAAFKFRIASLGGSENPDVHYLLGLSLWRSGELESAEQSLTRASSLDASSIRTWTNLARVRLERDDPTGAIRAIDNALLIDTSSADALHQKGRALIRVGRGKDALTILEEAHASDPGNGYIGNTLGYLLIQMDRPEEALPFLEEARAILPEVAYVRNNLGVAYERVGRLERAIEEYRASVEEGDPEGKASASIARLEPVVRRIIADRGSDEGETVAQSIQPPQEDTTPPSEVAPEEDDSGGQ
jgi:Flp pilus assembly protein TadD